jgi:ANTAR domain-containing protein
MQEIGELEDLRERLAAAEELNAQLEHALESRVVIEQAKGVLAERLGLAVDDAFDLLRYSARTARVRLHELAARVVHERRTPNPVVVALARRSRWRAALMRERNEALRSDLDELADAVRAQLERLGGPGGAADYLMGVPRNGSSAPVADSSVPDESPDASPRPGP